MGAGGTPDFQYSRIFIDPPGTVNVCLGSTSGPRRHQRLRLLSAHFQTSRKCMAAVAFRFDEIVPAVSGERGAASGRRT
jgi:hypothetical protein